MDFIKTEKNRTILLILFTFIIFFSLCFSTNDVIAEKSKPVLNFTNSGVTFNKESKLLRFNLKWSHPEADNIKVMYSIDDNEYKELGVYKNQNDQVIAHIYLTGTDGSGTTLNLYAEDSNGKTSDIIASEFSIASSPGITIEDNKVPLSMGEGTWSIINLFFAALSIAMLAVSVMLYFEYKGIKEFHRKGKMKSLLILLITFVTAAGNVFILLSTQSLKHRMVMIDNMTVSMMIITILGIISTMMLAVRAYQLKSDKDTVNQN